MEVTSKYREVRSLCMLIIEVTIKSYITFISLLLLFTLTNRQEKINALIHKNPIDTVVLVITRNITEEIKETMGHN